MSPAATDITEFLARTPLFAQVKREYLPSIAARLPTRVFAANETVFDTGDDGDAMLIIQTGVVGVFLADPTVGLLFEMARLRAGEVVGEMALLGGQRRSATCRALESTQCLVLDNATFSAIVERVPQVALSLATMLAQRVEKLNRDRGRAKASLSDLRIDPEVIRIVPRRLVERHRMIPTSIAHGKMLVACVDTDDLTGLDEIRRLVRGVDVHAVAISEADFRGFIDKHGDKLQRDVVRRPRQRPANIRWSSEELKAEGHEAGGEDTKRLVDSIVAEGIDLEASDIHLEPELEGVVVRYRVVGGLIPRGGPPIPRTFRRAIVSRIKVLADLDISDRRRPQDGRMSCQVGDRPYDLRVSTLPTHEGEKVVMRILSTADAVMPIERLILAEKVCRVVRQMVHLPHGVIFVCGPTGSGKTTTLYSSVGLRRQPDTNITTVEDPVEYNIPGITQVGVNPDVGLTFASTLRSILRQDPDVIMVGETRDRETAKIALEAGLTGHLVLTSLHTNDALGAIQRLREMGVENFAIAAALVGIISQRLVRRVCANCGQDEQPSPHVLEQLVHAGIVRRDFSGTTRTIVGCDVCSGTGFRGRVGAYELLVADDDLRQDIIADAGQFKLRETAARGTYVPMTRYFNYLLTNGLTTPGEVLAMHSGAGA